MFVCAKLPIVLFSNTTIQPLAVMIHSINTLVAQFTMPCRLGSSAPPLWIKIRNYFYYIITYTLTRQMLHIPV